jgi:hypothetical protein
MASLGTYEYVTEDDAKTAALVINAALKHHYV